MRRGQRLSKTTGDVPRRAAQYVRMSTEHQKYSTANQLAAIARYASERGLTIVKTYHDGGRSGLRIKGRVALQRLIADVQSRQSDFDTVLVYDVSRWGRFQDADESAYYEFICKLAGFAVHYCAEQFENDGSLVTTLLKSMKRAMAAEYSREMSVKTFAGQCRISSLGFKAGGPSGYGLRRHIVDQFGNRKGELRPGERKAYQSDRVILVPGPAHEIEIVQKIYQLYLRDDLTQKDIAHVLNRDGALTEEGRAWTYMKVHGILTKEKYIGNHVYNRTSQKLRTNTVPNPPEMWIRHEHAFEPIISVELFKAARRKMDSLTCVKMTDAEMIDRLKALLHREGALSERLIDAAQNMPSAACYQRRFLSLIRARELAGYKPKYNYDYIQVRRGFRPIVLRVIEDIIRNIESLGGTARFDQDTKLLQINDEFATSVHALYCNNYKLNTPRWRIQLPANPKAAMIVCVRMNESNTDVLDYYLLPRIDLSRRDISLRRQNSHEIDAYRCDTLATFLRLCSRQQVGKEAGIGSS